MTTNYERIKNMTVEEMAKWLQKLECQTCDFSCCGSDLCITDYKQWLNSESEE